MNKITILFKLSLSVLTLTFFSVFTSTTALSKVHNYKDLKAPIYSANYSKFTFEEIPKTLRIVTYNIKYSNNLNEVSRILLTHPEIMKADIIALQEVSGDPKNGEVNAANTLAKAISFNYIYAPAVIHRSTKRDFGNAILSRYPLSDYKKTILPQRKPETAQRISLSATVEIGKYDLRVHTVHLANNIKKKIRLSQTNAVIDLVLNEGDVPSVTLGDFNSVYKSEVLTRVKKKRIIKYNGTVGKLFTKSRIVIEKLFEADGFQNETEKIGYTYESFSPLKKFRLWFRAKLDHIFTLGIDCNNAQSDTSLDASDHFPIWCDLDLSSGNII